MDEDFFEELLEGAEKSASYFTISELASECDEDEIYEPVNSKDRKSLEEVKQKLAELGLTLRNDYDECDNDQFTDVIDNDSLNVAPSTKPTTWQNDKIIGRIYKKDNHEYYIEISVKIYNNEPYLVFLKHRPWKAQDRPLAMPLELAGGFFKLLKGFKSREKESIAVYGDN